MKYELVRFDKTLPQNTTEKTGQSAHVGEVIKTGKNCNGFLETVMAHDLDKYCFQIHWRKNRIIHSFSIGEFDFEKIERQENKKIAEQADVLLKQFDYLNLMTRNKKNKLQALYAKAHAAENKKVLI